VYDIVNRRGLLHLNVNQRAPKDAEAVTGAAAISASPSRGCRRRWLSCARGRTRQVLRRCAVTKASRSSKRAGETRPWRSDHHERSRWQGGGRHLGCGSRFGLSRARIGGGPQAHRFSLSGGELVRWATSSLVEVAAKAVARGIWERFLARGGNPPNRRRSGLFPSSKRNGEATRGVRIRSRLGKIRHDAVGCRGGGREEHSFHVTPELGGFG
jgi:hypothetical protein